jgi:hypothetical protein
MSSSTKVEEVDCFPGATQGTVRNSGELVFADMQRNVRYFLPKNRPVVVKVKI